jgi:membrane-bound lytic murein transglycosylase D
LDHLPAGASSTNPQQYRIRNGDSACGIALRFKVNCRELARSNKLGKKSMVKIGHILNIPGGRMVSDKPVTEVRSRIFNDKIFSAQAIMNAPITKTHLPDKKYKVALGDTTCEIADNHNMSCRELMRINNISNAAKIIAGKTLTIPGKIKIIVGKTVVADQPETINTQIITEITQSQQPIEPDKQLFAEVSYTSYLNRLLNKFKFDKQIDNSTISTTVVAQKQVARLASTSSDSIITAEKTPTKHDISELSAQQSDHNNSSIAKIKPQSEKIVSVAAIDYTQMKKILSADEIARAFGSTDDLSVTIETGKSATAWTIKVATDETLGHYADWLKIGFSKPILKLNKIKSSRSVRLGQTIQLPIKDQATKKLFEEKRIAYHRALQKQYFNQYLVTGKKQYRFQSGDNPWTIASSHQIPLWLLKRFNPGIFENMHDIGNVVVLPVLEPQQS